MSETAGAKGGTLTQWTAPMFSASLEEDDDWAQTMITSLTNLRNKQEEEKVVRLNGDLMGKWESNYRQTFCVASDM